MKKFFITLPGGYNIGNPPGFKSNEFTDLGSILSGLFSVVFYISGFLTLIWMVWGIFEYILAGGYKQKLI